MKANDYQPTQESTGDEGAQQVAKPALWSFGIAIIVHSIIDGLAIGIFSEVDQLLILAIGVIIHKIPVSCSVGSTFLANDQTPSQWSTLIVFILFILASPIGMIIGMVIGKSNHETPLLSILQAISGGTFVYLSCCHLLIHEFHQDHLEKEKIQQYLNEQQSKTKI